MAALVFLRRRDVGEPPIELGRAEMRTLTRNERRIAQLDAEIACLRIYNDFSRVFVVFENLADDLIEVERVGTGNLHHAVYRLRKSRLGNRGRDIFCRHRLEPRVRQAHCVTFDGRLRDATEELKELGGADDRVWNWRALDDVLLHQLSAKIAAVLQALGSDDRERDVMLDAGSHFGCREVLARSLEKVHRGLIFE